jgi:O-antigen ligase
VGGIAVTMVADRWFAARDDDGAASPAAVSFPSWVPWLLLAPAAILVAGLYASWSRGGWMGFGAAVLAMGALLPRRGFWGVLVAVLIVALGLGLYATGRLPADIADRLTGFLAYARFEDVRGVGITDANFAVIERMAHWQAAISMWRANFWTGVGLGCYEAAYPDHNLINWTLPLGHAHNIYLNLLAETGLLGLVAYFVWQGMLILRLVAASRELFGWQRGLALGLLGAWTQIAVHGLVDNLLVNNVHLHVGVLLALSAWVLQRQKPDVERQDT